MARSTGKAREKEKEGIQGFVCVHNSVDLDLIFIPKNPTESIFGHTELKYFGIISLKG